MAGKVNVPIAVAIQGLTKTQSQLKALGGGLSSLGKTAGLAAVGFAAFTAGVKSTDFAVQAIAGARDLERNLAGLKTVFEDITPQMTTFSKNAVNMGLSMNEAAKSSTFIGSVLKQSGFDIEQTAQLTERLVGLATDLSITYGYDVQEALLGMTALFRGEYDPIEKFGVAMKQSEINSELAARGMSNLEGAQRRFAEQQIRVELLFQRSSDASGAYQRQTGTLAVEQQKLAATFANVKDTVATSLLPVITQLMIDLQGVMKSVGPELKQVFDDLVPVIANAANVLVPALVDAFMLFVEILKEIISLIGDIFNPVSKLGESFTALGIQVSSVFQTITGNELTVTSVFDIIATVIGYVVDALHDVIYVIDNTIIGFKVMGEMVTALFNGDWEKLFTTDWTQQITSQIALKDAFNANQLAVAQFNAEIANTKNVLSKANTAWSNSWIARGEWWAKNNPAPSVAETILDTGTDGGGSTKTQKAVKDYVADLVANIREEVQKQTARLQLEKMTGSKGLIDSILGSEGWMKIWIQIKSGKLSLADLETQFYKTAAGAQELSDSAEEARKAWEDYDAAIKAINDDLAAELVSIAEKYDAVQLSFQDMVDAFAILPTVSRQLGQFENSAVSYLASIEESLKSAFRNGDIFENAYTELKNYARQELSALAAIEKQRDDMAERYSLADALIKEYRSAFTSALSLTNLFSKLSTETQTRTVTEVSQGVVKLGSDLRTFNVTVSKSYEETLDSVADKSAGLLDGFKQMAIKARAFAENLKQLKALGLDPMLFDQLVQAGVEAGGETAQALIDGGSDTINELNSIFSEIDSLGADLGEQVAMTLYGTGIDMADGLMAGIASKQSELETQAKALAEAFNTAFSSNITTAVGQVQSAAESTARSNAANAIAEVVVPTIPRPETMVDQAALNQLDALIAKAGSYATNIGDATKAAGALVKSDIYQQLRDVVAAGGSVNLAGIESGLSSAELTNRAAVAAAGSVTYNVNVTANTRLSGAKAGEAVVQTLKNYESANGPISTVLTT